MLRRYPDEPTAANNPGISLRDRGQLARAESVLKIGMDNGPAAANQYVHLAATYVNEGRFDDAEAVLRRGRQRSRSTALMDVIEWRI